MLLTEGLADQLRHLRNGNPTPTPTPGSRDWQNSDIHQLPIHQLTVLVVSIESKPSRCGQRTCDGLHGCCFFDLGLVAFKIVSFPQMHF